MDSGIVRRQHKPMAQPRTRQAPDAELADALILVDMTQPADSAVP